MDARAKLLSAILFVSAAVAGRSVVSQVVITGILGLVFGLGRLPWSLLARSVRGALWLAVFVVVANAGWSVVSRHAGWGTGEATLHDVADYALLLLRLGNLLFVAALLSATTIPVDAAEGLERLLRPLSRWRVPVHELGFLLVLALSFVPLFWRETRRLVDAHRVKVGAARWGIGDRLRAAIPLLVPLFLGVLRRADELAVALDARGFVPGERRTSLVEGHAGWPEATALALGLAACVVVAWLGRHSS